MEADRPTRSPGEAGAAMLAPTGGRKLGDRVYGALKSAITQGEYPPESKLPGEHELSAKFGVSRPILRDALGRLREEGLIYSRQGSGSFVRAQRPTSPVLAFAPVGTIADLYRCYEFRLSIEADGAYFAALRRDKASLARLAEALNLLSDATKHRHHREDADFMFHRAVSEAANNHYYTSALDALRQHIAVGMHLHGQTLMGPGPQLERVFEEHQRIYLDIEAGNSDAAREAMRRHLEGSRDRLFGGQMVDLALARD
ncbi:FadR/GntR family transcriptional regulator [Methylobrevis albus]|uniref:FadR family transcriptional regulator n=1 Tax=Methylobrevis albus TaxID=2793297 RepID=A0A931I365_9HYPH|nr:FadR family transcriptional regulator [Methylobrevis albus]